MNKFVLMTGAALVATATAALAQPAEGPRRDRNADMTREQVVARVDQRFARLDVNRDGQFTREEARQVRAQRREQRAERRFDRLDADRDGSITREEMTQARAQRAEQRAERRAARMAARGDQGAQAEHRGRRVMRHGPRRGAAMGARMFGEQGFVTAEQMRERALARFDRIDADRNGTVTAAERDQARAQRREEFRQRREQRRNSDG